MKWRPALARCLLLAAAGAAADDTIEGFQRLLARRRAPEQPGPDRQARLQAPGPRYPDPQREAAAFTELDRVIAPRTAGDLTREKAEAASPRPTAGGVRVRRRRRSLFSTVRRPGDRQPTRGRDVALGPPRGLQLTVYSLSIDAQGGFDLARYARALTDEAWRYATRDGSGTRDPDRSGSPRACRRLMVRQAGSGHAGPAARSRGCWPRATLRPPPSSSRSSRLCGVATVEDVKTGEVRQRDMDIVIEPYRDDGFAIRWVNVTLVDGRRDVPGVERQVQNVLFERRTTATYPRRGDREQPVPRARGDPADARRSVRGATWTRTLRIRVRGRETARTNCRSTTEVLTEKGIDMVQRIVDDEVLRRITGTTARRVAGRDRAPPAGRRSRGSASRSRRQSRDSPRPRPQARPGRRSLGARSSGRGTARRSGSRDR